MARYTEAVCKLCRREGQKLFLRVRDATQISARSTAGHTLPASMVRAVKRLPSTVCSCAQSR